MEDASKRLIKIDSERMDAYIKVSFVNTMNAKFSSLNLKSTKADKLQHGFGASIIDKILIQYNGFSNRYTTSDNGVDYYHLEIFLPTRYELNVGGRWHKKIDVLLHMHLICQIRFIFSSNGTPVT